MASKDVQVEVTYQEPQDEKWSDLFYEFTDATTLHGLRYVCMRSTWLLRRIIWFLALTAAIVVFVYLNAQNIERFLSNPKKINMDVSVKNNLTFPAVTICNYNFHKFTSVADMGLFDSFYTLYDQKAHESVNGDWYHYREDLCIYDKKILNDIIYCRTNLTENPCSSTKTNLIGVSSAVCEYSCTNQRWCTGFWYNRTSLTCTISATVLVKDLNLAIGNTTGETNGTPAIQVIKDGVCKKESVEYYNRIRILGMPSFMCTFDLDDCSQIHNSSMQHARLDSFIISEANHPNKDYSTDSERGRYLYVHETNTRPGSSAILLTDYYTMRDSCLEFYYYFIGQGKTKLEVTLNGKSYPNIELKSIEGNERHRRWKRFYEKIPDGEGGVKLLMIRPNEENSLTTGIAIDNFAIQPCYKYKQNCLHDPRGITYEGNITVTETGEACSNKSRRVPPVCQNMDHDVKPWCLTETSWNFCNIPHCGCSTEQFWCSKSKRCIPKSFTCDGMDDCGDRQDETEPCESKMSISCRFRNKFVCGYQSIALSLDLMWRFATAKELVSRHAPKEGQFMFVETDLASEGDKAILRSPAFTLPATEQCLRFSLHSYNNGYGTLAKLEIVLVPEDQLEYNNVTLKVIRLRNFTKGWHNHYVKLPINGEQVGSGIMQVNRVNIHPEMDGSDQIYYADLIYTMGLPSKSNVGLRYVYLGSCRTKDNSTVSTEVIEKRRRISCTDFSDTSACPVHVVADSATVTCGPTTFSYQRRDASHILMEGTFESPGYPDQTSAEHVLRKFLADIIARKNSTIILSFYGFSLKSYTEDLCPQHLLVHIGKHSKGTFNESRYCITHEVDEETSLSFQTDYMVIFAVANYTSYPVFRGYYKINPSEEADPADHSLVCYKGHGTGLVRDHNDILVITDPLYFDSPQCLSFLARSHFAEIKVILGGRQHVEIIKGDSNYSKFLGRLTIPPGSYRIEFWARLPSYAQNEYVLEILHIKTEPGFCAEIDVGGSVTCAFSRDDSCGYNDVSPGHTRWTAKNIPREMYKKLRQEIYGDSRNYGDYGMLLEYAASKKSHMRGYLLSPWFEVDSVACINISMVSTNKTVMQIYTLRSLDVLKNYSLVQYTDVTLEGWLWSTEVEVTAGYHYIMFGIEAKDINNIFITDITFTDGLCNQSQNISEKTWNVGYHDFIMDLERQISEVAIKETKPTSEPASQLTGSFDTLIPLGKIIFDRRHRRRDYSAYFSVDDVFEQTAHELEDLIFSCDYNEKPCDFKRDFLRQRTEYGVCYTFNPRGNTTLKYVTTPGSTHGLILVMNSEAYEMSKGFSTDSGVKVHVHDQDEIPFVHLVGLAAAVSHHTYFAITLKEFKSLGAPYGNCGIKDLDLFQNDTYTRFRCNRECTTRQWETTCDCRSHYMSGDYEYCSFQKYTKCFDEIVDDGSNSCDCPTACHIVSFSTQSSMSSLSPLGMSELLLQTEKVEKIQEKYNKLLNYDHRMIPEKFENIMSQMDRVITSSVSLIYFIGKHAAESPNSRFNLLQMALSKLYLIVYEDVSKVNPILEEIKESEQCYNSTATARRKILRSIVDDLDYVVLMQEAGIADNPKLLMKIKSTNQSIEMMETLERKACMRIRHSENLERRFVSPDESDYAICSVLSRQRAKELQTTSGNLVSILTMTDEELRNDTTRNMLKQTLAFFKDLINKHETYDVQFLSFLDAALSLKTKLDFFERKTLSNAKQVKDELQRSMYKYHSFWYNIMRKFRTNSRTITQLASLVAKSEFVNIKRSFRRFMSRMENEVIAVLLNEIDYKGPKHLYHIYMDSLNLYSRITQYTKSDVTDKITLAVKNMKIWRFPTSKLDDADLIWFRLTLKEVKTYFRLPLDTFSILKAPGFIKMFLGSLFNDLASEIDGMVQSYLDVFQEFETSFIKLNNSLQEVSKEAVIDQEFIVKNFLRLDVFYDELTHEIVEQTPAYELTQVFSDLGGYLGLLLGASIITICEFLDLVFHYIFMRCKHSSDNKKAKPMKQGINSV